MRPFKYVRASDPAGAVRAVAANPRAKFLAGGTNILDLMKEDVERPDELVDLNRLGLAEIKATPGGLSIGALATNCTRCRRPSSSTTASSAATARRGSSARPSGCSRRRAAAT